MYILWYSLYIFRSIHSKTHECIIISIVECILDESEKSYHMFFSSPCQRNEDEERKKKQTKYKNMAKRNKFHRRATTNVGCCLTRLWFVYGMHIALQLHSNANCTNIWDAWMDLFCHNMCGAVRYVKNQKSWAPIRRIHSWKR